jgi:hypothetical protein
MADPILDENIILSLLEGPPAATMEDIGRLQSAALQALTDLHDRKVTREHYLHSSAAAVALFGQAAKLWMLLSVKSAFEHGDLDAARFQEAEAGLLRLLSAQVKTVHSVVTEVMQCPTSQDLVH